MTSVAPTHTATPSSHYTGHTTTGADIPTSTVAAIGGGFVGFALMILLGLTGLRAFRVWREARQKRRNGEQVTFRQLWRRQGGFWGFVTGTSGEMVIVGAGGRSERAFWNGWTRWEMELERHLREELREGKVRSKMPIMCEVEIPKEGGQGLQEFHPGQDQPMGVSASSEKANEPDSNPKLDLAVLILLPSPGRVERRGDDEFDDLPDMVMGTTCLHPVIQPPVSFASTDSVSANHWEQGEKMKEDGGVVVLEYAPTSVRPAQWKKRNNEWVVEGLS